jgi:hypothetical protein
VLRKIVVYHTRKHKNVKKKNGYDLKLLSFKKTKTLNVQGINTLSKIHIY